MDSGFDSDHSESLNKFLGVLLAKYQSIIRELTSSTSNLGNFSFTIIIIIAIELVASHDEGLPLPFVVKWVDYSNKYGFACTLRSGVRSMLYNDQSNITIS